MAGRGSGKHRRVGRRRFTDEQFVRAWNSTESPMQLAARLGTTTELVKRYAKALRGRGIDLPEQRVCP